MNDTRAQKLFFHPVCSQEEIDRIFNVQSPIDYLLKLRAETIVDHMRLFRVYRNKALRDEKNWSLERSFDDTHYKAVLDKLPSDELKLCEKVTYGDIFSNDPNGMIFHTGFGPITTISESLSYFLKFAHLAILDFDSTIPDHVRSNSLRIAIRVMLKTEALDFFMDQRGIIPPEITSVIYAPIPLQMKFIAGHEFSHFILGHLSKKNLVEQPIFFAISESDGDYRPEKVFNTSHLSEFEADVQSILLPAYSQEERAELFHAALLWFGCLALYQAASDVMFPKNSLTSTHPTALDRYDNLLSKIPTPKGFHIKEWSDFPKLIGNLTQMLQEDISLNFDTYETYGSVYLDKPNTLWRGKELIDRVDYY